MKNSTIRQLSQLNKTFYESQADSFSQNRQAPWPGWRKLLPYIEQIKDNPIKVLDVGCGNGRFGQFLKENINQTLDYIGTDNSRELLKIAQSKNPEFNFVYLDLIENLLTKKPIVPINQKYDCIVLFGVLHHIPSHSLRKRLLEELSNSLKPNGLLVFTIWRFGELNRFADKLVDPKVYPIDPAELETGDCLVDWRDFTERQTAQLTEKKSFPVRYAHAISTKETTKLLQNLPPVLINFLADGKDNQTNHYWVVKK